MTFNEAKDFATLRAIEEKTRMALWSHIEITSGDLVFTVSDDRNPLDPDCRPQGSVSAAGVYSS